jgi:hypothetical protein
VNDARVCSAHLIQLAFITTVDVSRVIVLDGVKLGELEVCQLLTPLLSSELALKLFRDLNVDASALATIASVTPLQWVRALIVALNG